MMIECNIHGLAIGILVSKDLIELNADQVKVLKIDFEYRDRITFIYYISEDYGKQFGIFNSQKLPLPNDYPDWVLQLKPMCGDCFEEKFNLPIDA